MECFLFFFFQAEDGIRDLTVTGVQTCALPISGRDGPVRRDHCAAGQRAGRLYGGTPRLESDSRRDRKSVVEGKRVDLGGRRIIKKKKKKKKWHSANQ